MVSSIVNATAHDVQTNDQHALSHEGKVLGSYGLLFKSVNFGKVLVEVAKLSVPKLEALGWVIQVVPFIVTQHDIYWPLRLLEDVGNFSILRLGPLLLRTSDNVT